MEKLSMCRVCLGEDIRLRSIVETHLQEMYESLVLMPFETKDRRPMLACYICCARLQNCYDLKRSCLRSEELLRQMLSGDELKPMKLQEIYNKKRLTMHNVVHFSLGHELQMSTDNVGVEALMYYDVKVEQSDPEDINEDAQEEDNVYVTIQSADLDNDPLIIVKEEQYRDSTSATNPKESEQAVQRMPEDSTSNNAKDYKLTQNKFEELNNVNATDRTPAKSTYEVTFTLNVNNKERSTSVPHSERVQYTCDTYQQCYSSKYKLERHTRLSSDVWKEDLSRESSTSSDTHTGQRPHQCRVCGKRFSCMNRLTQHTRTHTGEKPYHCDICKRNFSQNGTLTKHMRTHTGEKPYHCSICKKQFSQKITLSNHIRTHTGEKPHLCYLCKKSFINTSNLSRHMRTHTGEKPFQCEICQKQFSQKNTLCNHMRTHTDEKPHLCNLCKKSFINISNLSRHMRTHTGEKPFHCDICPKQFSKKSTLCYHMRTHTGEKHLCNLYKKNFINMTNLSRHMRTHTDKKPFQCDICPKQFSRKSTLSNHIRTHTGEKRHQCDICKKYFSDRSNLIKHIRTQTCKKRVNQSSPRPALT